MVSISNENNTNNMQISVQHPTLSEIISSTPKENICKKRESEFLTKPVRLSAFLKELEEAKNEPIPDIKHENEVEDTDETDKEEDEESKPNTIEKFSIDTKSKQTNQFLNEHMKKTDLMSQANIDLSVKWLHTPAKQLLFKQFLTPNMSNFNKRSFNDYYTEDRNYIKVQSGQRDGKNVQTPLNLVPFRNTQSSRKKSLFCSQIKKHYDEDVIYEAQELEDKENDRNKENTGDSSPKVLCSIPIEKPIDPFEKITVNNIEYVILNKIGCGGSSIVFHCYEPIEMLERAIKKVNLKGDRTCVHGYINEVKMLYKLQKCDCIIKMYAYEIIKSEKVLLMVLEKGEKDLSKILKDLSNNTNHLPMYMLIYYWMEMLYAVKQIHSNGIIHSDLKPANFLMVSSKLKLIDFGIASSIQNDMTSVVKNVQIGSFNYISPEALINNSQDSETAKFKISFKSDVWSLGCILYQLVYRRTPFQHIGHAYAKLSAIIDPKQTIKYPEVDWVPQNVIRTIKSCLQYNTKSRPSIDDLIKDYENMYY